jgi:hypothetical protein
LEVRLSALMRILISGSPDILELNMFRAQLSMAIGVLLALILFGVSVLSCYGQSQLFKHSDISYNSAKEPLDNCGQQGKNKLLYVTLLGLCCYVLPH